MISALLRIDFITVKRSSSETFAAKYLSIMLRKVKGEGMYPTLEKGQLVLIKRQQRFKVDDIVVFVHEGSEKIKRICGIEGDFLYVLGDNPSYSNDSRHYGYIRKEMVIGKLIYPIERKK